MTDIAIRCEGLGKQYRIGERESYKALRDVITDAFTSPFRRVRSALRQSPNGSSRPEKPNIWALNDLSFEIKRGEVVGIIGRNGAGKSTLLKILSRITEPTRGYVDIWGRVGSLLEVGTGFHPELTGRDNIFLNGAILGMRRAEVGRKFDEIVAFAEVEKFIDTPVKRYSSGMYVRLAFAVAAHMETEILLVDEVLAVGDAQFQKKCLGKMRDVSKGGRTVLFVSHNMSVIQALCPTTILLQDGDLQFMGSSNEAAALYLEGNGQSTCLERPARSDGTPTVTRLELTHLECHENTVMDLQLTISGRMRKRCSVEFKLFDALGVAIGFASIGLLNPAEAFELREDVEELRCRLELPRMARGIYRVSVQLAIPMVEIIDSTEEGLLFELHPMPLAGYTRVMESSWGYGAFEFPIHVERVSHHPSGKEAARITC
jgi:lipopolysaccharide transport system ATP-binding protein